MLRRRGLHISALGSVAAGFGTFATHRPPPEDVDLEVVAG